jgi:hypothetical protein
MFGPLVHVGKRHGLLMHGSAVAVLHQCVLSRRHLPYAGVAGPGLGIEEPDREADALLDVLLTPVDVAPFLAVEGMECQAFGNNPDDAEVYVALVGLDESDERFGYLLHSSFIEAMHEVSKAGPGARAILRAETPYRELFGAPPA